MENFLETIITVLIGLGAFFISSLRKRKAPKKQNSSQAKEIDDFFADETDTFSSDEREYAAYSSQERHTVDSNPQPEKERITTTERFSTKPAPDQQKEKRQEDSYYSTEKNKKSKAVIQQSRKHSFNARKAIIYATIINRKYF